MLILIIQCYQQCHILYPPTYLTPYDQVLFLADIELSQWLIKHCNADPTTERVLKNNKEGNTTKGLVYPMPEGISATEVLKIGIEKRLLEKQYILDKLEAQVRTEQKEDAKIGIDKAAEQKIFEELSSNYINIKKRQIEVPEHNEPDDRDHSEIFKKQFDLLLLTSLAANDDSKKEVINKQIKDLIQKKSYLQKHVLTSLFENDIQRDKAKSMELQAGFLSGLPTLLHRYCQLKKNNIEEELQQLVQAAKNEGNPSLDTIPNLYKIKSTMESDAFIYIHPELNEILQNTKNNNLNTKLRKLLEQGIQFIHHDSQDHGRYQIF